MKQVENHVCFIAWIHGTVSLSHFLVLLLFTTVSFVMTQSVWPMCLVSYTSIQLIFSCIAVCFYLGPYSPSRRASVWFYVTSFVALLHFAHFISKPPFYQPLSLGIISHDQPLQLDRYNSHYWYYYCKLLNALIFITFFSQSRYTSISILIF